MGSSGFFLTVFLRVGASPSQVCFANGFWCALNGALAWLWRENGLRGEPSDEGASACHECARKTWVYAPLMTAGVWVDGHMDWVLVHEELERLAKECAELDGREGLVLLRAQRVGVHRHLGYASIEQYVERLFGYSART